MSFGSAIMRSSPSSKKEMAPQMINGDHTKYRQNRVQQVKARSYKAHALSGLEKKETTEKTEQKRVDGKHGKVDLKL